MEAIILAGGKGTRLKSIVSTVPKPMALINGRPFLELLMLQLSCYSFKRIILSIGHLGDVIQAHFGPKFKNIDIVYLNEHTPLGTGGAVREAMKACQEDHVYIMNGDTFQLVDFNKVEEYWQSNKNPIMIAAEVTDTSRYGALLIEKNKVIGFSEKGKTGPGYINAGYYVFNKAQTNLFPNLGVFSLEQDFLEEDIYRHSYDFFKSARGFIDIGIPEDYVKAQSHLSEFWQ